MPLCSPVVGSSMLGQWGLKLPFSSFLPPDPRPDPIHQGYGPMVTLVPVVSEWVRTRG